MLKNVDCTPEVDKPSDMSNGTSDSPLTFNEPDRHQVTLSTYLPKESYQLNK